MTAQQRRSSREAPAFRPWEEFTIRCNKKAHFFLCIAWKDRKSLVPEHLWLIPGSLVNMKTGFGITDSPGSLAKWVQYERSLKNVVDRCNELRGV